MSGPNESAPAPPRLERVVLAERALGLPSPGKLTERAGETGITAPDWIPLAPAGELIEARDGRKFHVEDVELILARTSAEGGVPMPLDLDHDSFGDFLTNPHTEAYAWVDRVEYVEEADDARSEPGFWGHVERWTEAGRTLVEGGYFRGISPVMNVEHRETRNEDGEVIGEEVFLHSFYRSAALTNRPALPPPLLISERSPNPSAPTPAPERETMHEDLVELGRSLGLKGEFTPATLAEAVRSGLVPKGELEAANERADKADAALLEDMEKRLAEKADAAVDGAIKAGKIQPSSRDFYRGGITDEASLSRFTAHVAGLESQTTEVDTPEEGAPVTASLTSEDLGVAESLGLTPEEFAAEKKDAIAQLDARPGSGVVSHRKFTEMKRAEMAKLREEG